MPSTSLFQAYSAQGEPEESLTREEIGAGALHGASHVWIWRKITAEIEVLLQTRSKTHRTWPGYLDISAAGHIDFGEDPITAAIREVKEEIALDISTEDLKLVSVQYDRLSFGDLIENEFQWLFLYEMKSKQEVKLTDGEVDNVEWKSLSELRRIIDSKDSAKIVPHSDAYYTALLQSLELIT